MFEREQPKRGQVATLTGLSCALQTSIATQCDTKRFRERIPHMVRVWRGPIVIVVLLRSMAEMHDLRAVVIENPLVAACAAHMPSPSLISTSVVWV